MSTDPNTEESLITPGVDFYTFIHKSFRNRLYQAASEVGCTDWSVQQTSVAIRAQLEQLFDDLEEHAAHESEFWHPLIAKVNPDALRGLEREHATQGHEIAVLRALLASASMGDVEAGQELYRALNVFIGEFLLHLAEEETGNPLLWSTYREGQLNEAYHAFKLTIPLDESLRYVESMLPAMNPQERSAFIESLSGAPAAVLEAVHELSVRVLGPTRMKAPTA